MIDAGTYQIVFEQDSFSYLNELLSKKKYSKHFVLVDENTQEHCLPILQGALGTYELQVITIAAGEEHKNLETCQQIWQQLLALGADRKAVLLNLGGGVIGDMGGFCASTFKRGMDFIQLPSTLLSQVDASVGGKLGVDFEQVKNIIGLFNTPQAVIVHSDFLKTLPLREIYSGFAETIKHALIQDKEQWTKISQWTSLENVDWAPVIEHSIQIKNRIVQQDPTEQNIRKSLNFGHTIGHALESLSFQTAAPLLHGEAVAIGMICESYLSHKLLGMSPQGLKEITDFILNLYTFPPLAALEEKAFLQLIQQDKKNEQEQLCFTLLKGIGEFAINIDIGVEAILESIEYIQKELTIKQI
ncbi:MAG: 3-dehydroquinate synthase [Aureispira sp.]|nr:3-dehydroquinate synthase [Aureispira sp.]